MSETTDLFSATSPISSFTSTISSISSARITTTASSFARTSLSSSITRRTTSTTITRTSSYTYSATGTSATRTPTPVVELPSLICGAANGDHVVYECTTHDALFTQWPAVLSLVLLIISFLTLVGLLVYYIYLVKNWKFVIKALPRWLFGSAIASAILARFIQLLVFALKNSGVMYSRDGYFPAIIPVVWFESFSLFALFAIISFPVVRTLEKRAGGSGSGYYVCLFFSLFPLLGVYFASNGVKTNVYLEVYANDARYLTKAQEANEEAMEPLCATWRIILFLFLMLAFPKIFGFIKAMGKDGIDTKSLLRSFWLLTAFLFSYLFLQTFYLIYHNSIDNPHTDAGDLIQQVLNLTCQAGSFLSAVWLGSDWALNPDAELWTDEGRYDPKVANVMAPVPRALGRMPRGGGAYAKVPEQQVQAAELQALTPSPTEPLRSPPSPPTQQSNSYSAFSHDFLLRAV